MKKVLSLAMATLMILTALFVLAACEPTPDQPDNPVGPVDPGTDTDERESIDYLPSEPYGTEEDPASYNILQWTVDDQTQIGESWLPWEEADVERIDGGVLSEAVFNRNALVETKYGIDITMQYGSVNGSTTFETLLRTDASAEDNTYQLAIHRSVGITSLISNEMFADMNEYEQYLRTDKPWWVQDSVESMQLGDRLFVAASEILLRDKGATAALYFNQELAEDLNDSLPNFFDLVNKGTWTLEEMISAAEIAATPVGDSLVDGPDDIWGLVGDDDMVYMTFNGIGYKFVTPNEDGLLTVRYANGTNDSLADMQDIFENVIFSDWMLHRGVPDKSALVTEDEFKKMFNENKALFKSGMVKDTTTSLTSMQSLYGILPYPKKDIGQDDYSSLVWVHHDSLLGIPIAAADKEFCAVILEALSWESYYTVYPVFYDEILLARAAKDTESKAMIELIFQTRSWDPGLIWDNGDGNDGAGTGLHGGSGLLRLSNTGSADVASMWGDYSGTVEKHFEKINTWIQGAEIG